MQQALKIRVQLILLLPAVAIVFGMAAYMLGEGVFAIGFPLAVLLVYLLFNHIKGMYLFLLFCIPFSIHLDIIKDTLALSLPDEPLMWMLFGAGLLLFLGGIIKLPVWWYKDNIVQVVGLQLFFLIISVLFSKVPLLSVKFLLAKSWYLVCFFMLPMVFIRSKKDMRLVFSLMLAALSGCIIIVLSKHAYYLFSFSKIKEAVYLLFTNHVEYASLISMFLPLLWAAYKITRAERNKTKQLLALLIALFLVAVVLSYARAAILGLIFAVVCALAIKRKRVHYVMPVFYGLILLLLVYLIGFNGYTAFRPQRDKTYFRHNYTAHLSATLNKQDESAMERLYRWIAAVRMSRDEPITGFGPHSFYYYYKPYTLASFKTLASNNLEHSTTHNYFLLMLAEQGWPALLLYALLFPLLLSKAQRLYHTFNDPFYKYLSLGLIMLLAVNFVNNLFSELIETHKIGSLYYLSMALLVLLEEKQQSEISPASKIK